MSDRMAAFMFGAGMASAAMVVIVALTLVAGATACLMTGRDPRPLVDACAPVLIADSCVFICCYAAWFCARATSEK